MTRKRIAATIGLLSLAALALACVMFREPLIRRWHLHRLHERPELVFEYAAAGGVRLEAVESFLNSPSGKEAFANLFAGTMLATLDRTMMRGVRMTQSRDLARVVIALGDGSFQIAEKMVGSSGDSGSEWDNPSAIYSVVPEIRYGLFRERLRAVYGEEFAWRERPHLRLAFYSWAGFREVVRAVPASRRGALFPLDGLTADRLDPEDPVCVISPVGGDANAGATAGPGRGARPR